MATAARARGYQYMALTDHSRSLTITKGLSLERLEEARRLVEQVNQRLAPFVVLFGTEMDILLDGSLDYPDGPSPRSIRYIRPQSCGGFKCNQCRSPRGSCAINYRWCTRSTIRTAADSARGLPTPWTCRR